MSLTTELKEHAHKHGIELIGVTSAEAFEVDRPNTPIADPRTYLENAKAVVVWGLSYGTLVMEPLKPGALVGRCFRTAAQCSISAGEYQKSNGGTGAC